MASVPLLTLFHDFGYNDQTYVYFCFKAISDKTWYFAAKHCVFWAKMDFVQNDQERPNVPRKVQNDQNMLDWPFGPI